MLNLSPGNNFNEGAVDMHFICICHLIEIPDSYWPTSKFNVISNTALPKYVGT
jgi:hypothetical protein